jgi:hypothetical protein
VRKLTKLWLLFALTVFLALGSCAQLQQAKSAAAEATKEPPTKLEAFLAKKGKIIVKDFYSAGELQKLGSMKLDGVVLYEPGQEAQRVRGLKVEIKEAGRLERESSSFLDLDEVESLSKAIGYMQTLSQKWTNGATAPYTEVTFQSKGDFQLGFYQDGAKTGAYAKSGTIGTATMFFDLKDMAEIKQLVDTANANLLQK